jgi:hypothetical protein
MKQQGAGKTEDLGYYQAGSWRIVKSRTLQLAVHVVRKEQNK